MLFDIRDAGVVGRAVRPVRRARRRCCPRCGRRAGASASTAGGIGRLPGGHPDQRHRRRPAGRAVRPGLLRAGHDEEHLRHRLVRAHERRRRPARTPVEGLLDHRRRGPLGRRRPDRDLRARGRHLRRPARPSSGCATASASSTTRPRSGRWPRRCADTERRLPRARLHRARQPVVGSLRPGTIVGITRGTGRAHLARAVVEAMAYQTRDVVEAMTRRVRPPGRRAAGRRRRVRDGPAAAAPGRPAAGARCARPAVQETTALGAAYLAGLAEGVWALARRRQPPTGCSTSRFTPPPVGRGRRAYAQWRRAVERASGWATELIDAGRGSRRPLRTGSDARSAWSRGGPVR